MFLKTFFCLDIELTKNQPCRCALASFGAALASFGAALETGLGSPAVGLLEMIALLGVLEASRLACWKESSFFFFQVELLLDLKSRS